MTPPHTCLCFSLSSMFSLVLSQFWYTGLDLMERWYCRKIDAFTSPNILHNCCSARLFHVTSWQEALHRRIQRAKHHENCLEDDLTDSAELSLCEESIRNSYQFQIKSRGSYSLVISQDRGSFLSLENLLLKNAVLEHLLTGFSRLRKDVLLQNGHRLVIDDFPLVWNFGDVSMCTMG